MSDGPNYTGEAIAAAAAALAVNETIQRFHPERFIPGGPLVQNGALIAGGAAAAWGSTKMTHGVPRGLVLGAGIGAVLTGTMNALGL